MRQNATCLTKVHTTPHSITPYEHWASSASTVSV